MSIISDVIENTKAIIKGMSVTFSYIPKEKWTVQYPDEPVTMQPRYRGQHLLHVDELGREKCVACFLCAAACPSDCIYIIAADSAHRPLVGARLTRIASQPLASILTRRRIDGGDHVGRHAGALSSPGGGSVVDYPRIPESAPAPTLPARSLREAPADTAYTSPLAELSILVQLGGRPSVEEWLVLSLTGRPDHPSIPPG